MAGGAPRELEDVLGRLTELGKGLSAEAEDDTNPLSGREEPPPRRELISRTVRAMKSYTAAIEPNERLAPLSGITAAKWLLLLADGTAVCSVGTGRDREDPDDDAGVPRIIR